MTNRSITKSETLSIALAGNPNCGKTTLFNALTGSNQYVGNWAGVTVEKKSGFTADRKYEIVDLPGIYSLSPYSMEEIVTRDYIIKERPSAIINIIDGMNFERNLYLTVQLAELGIPMVLVVNMMDEVKKTGGSIDCCRLSQRLGIPVVPVSARKGENIDEVMRQIKHVINKNVTFPQINFDIKTQNALNEISALIYEKDKDIPFEFYASKLLENDKLVKEELALSPDITEKIEQIAVKYEKSSKYGDRETMLADARYTFIEDLAAETVVKGVCEDQPTISDKIDRVVTNKFLALPIFILIMAGIFALTFGPIGSALSDLIEKFFTDILSKNMDKWLLAVQAPEWTRSLIVNGIISGVGGILTFLPQIAILFLCLSILEDSGYMARAAFITDKFLRKLGLSGKSFIPMIMGFGCTTPAAMAARTQENINERRATIMLIPFMSCGAKLPIYALFASAFFSAYKGLVVFSMYLIGFLLAILAGLILKKTVFKTNSAPFVMELPSYRLPILSSVLKNTWDKCKGFIIKAGTIIFAMSVVIWVLQSFTPQLQYTTSGEDSIFGCLGAILAPLLMPLGFGDWRSGVSILSGLVAKEAVVSTMMVLYGSADEAVLSAAISGVYTPLSAFCFMLFCLLYMPCISAFATIKNEMGSMKWALASAGLQLATAYGVTLLVYQIGSLFVG
ncbi:MAG: ferrous iron transport protein B [Oscillospiraceae bacterium]